MYYGATPLNHAIGISITSTQIFPFFENVRNCAPFFIVSDLELNGWAMTVQHFLNRCTLMYEVIVVTLNESGLDSCVTKYVFLHV